MKLFLFLLAGIFSQQIALGNIIKVANLQELEVANKAAVPGDEIILLNGTWQNVNIVLTAKGTVKQPILFRAENAGQVLLTGTSTLRIGGSFLVIDGLYFLNGYTTESAVISFSTSKTTLANNCRITNIVINDYNPKRMEENYWIGLYGHHNRIDHCSFINKKNMGVLIAVMLDAEESRENYHSIDHNYFGERPPLASNTGEIVRVGVSTYCQYNSFTQITDNYFYHCDGETEVISLKSGGNLVKNNVLEECQGSVVCRHGDNNTVANNIFLGNDKPGTGGIRIINKGQWVVNNFFYKCRGIDFRSPLSIMNGVPNSPANRYVPVTDAVVSNNSFVNCTSISFAEGSDAERSVPPKDVLFVNNLFTTEKDSFVYKKFDDISGIQFANNLVSKNYTQEPEQGFTKTTIGFESFEPLNSFPMAGKTKFNFDKAFAKEARKRGLATVSKTAGFKDKNEFLKILSAARGGTGAAWFKPGMFAVKKQVKIVKCSNGKELTDLLKTQQKNVDFEITLTGRDYNFTEPISVKGYVSIKGSAKTTINFTKNTASDYLFMVAGNGVLSLSELYFNLGSIKVKSFISGDTSGTSNHSNIQIDNCSFSELAGNFYYAPKESVSDSIVVSNTSFDKIKGTLFNFMQEDGKKGYYNVEKLVIYECDIKNIKGQLLAMLRSGNDESTMGPNVLFRNNTAKNCTSDLPLISLYGTQMSRFTSNYFVNANKNGVVLKLEDKVRAHHYLINNEFENSGTVEPNEFVEVNIENQQ